MLALQSALICNASGGISVCQPWTRVNGLGGETPPWGEKCTPLLCVSANLVSWTLHSAATERRSYPTFWGQKHPLLGLTAIDLR